MRKIIQYFRSCFCKHKFELIKEVKTFCNDYDKRPTYIELVYRCKKCSYIQKIKI